MMNEMQTLWNSIRPGESITGPIRQRQRKVGEEWVTASEVAEFIDSKRIVVQPLVVPFINSMHKSYFFTFDDKAGFPLIALQIYDEKEKETVGILDISVLFADEIDAKHTAISPILMFYLLKDIKGGRALTNHHQIQSTQYSFNSDTPDTKADIQKMMATLPKSLYGAHAFMREIEWLREVFQQLSIPDNLDNQSLSNVNRLDSSAMLKVFINPIHQFMLCNIGASINRQDLQGAPEEQVTDICKACPYWKRFPIEHKMVDCPVRANLEHIQKKLDDGSLFPNGRIAVKETIEAIASEQDIDIPERMLDISSRELRKQLVSPTNGETEPLYDFLTIISSVNDRTGVYW